MKKSKAYHIVYETTNNINGMTYSGVHSTDILVDDYLGSGTRLNRTIKKYGPENFTRKILAICPTRAFALAIEAEIVTEEATKRKDNYNLTKGGGDPPHSYGEDHHMHRPEVAKKVSEALKELKAGCWSGDKNPSKNKEVIAKRSGNKHWRYRPFVMDGCIFQTHNEAAEYFGACRATISLRLSGKIKSWKDKCWYLDE